MVNSGAEASVELMPDVVRDPDSIQFVRNFYQGISKLSSVLAACQRRESLKMRVQLCNVHACSAMGGLL